MSGITDRAFSFGSADPRMSRMATHNTLLSDDSLSVRPEGLAIAIQLPWYRSLWLSSVSDIAVIVNGREVPTGRSRSSWPRARTGWRSCRISGTCSGSSRTA
jgi:hypothetical protein